MFFVRCFSNQRVQKMKFKNLNLRTKEIIGFGIILAIMAGDHMFSIRNMAALKSELDEVSKSWLPRAVAISDININTAKLRSNQLQHVFATNDELKQDQLIRMAELITQIEANRDTYEQLTTQSEEKNLYSEEDANLYAAFDDKLDEYLELSFEFLTKKLKNDILRRSILVWKRRADESRSNFGATQS